MFVLKSSLTEAVWDHLGWIDMLDLNRWCNSMPHHDKDWAKNASFVMWSTLIYIFNIMAFIL